MTDHDDTARRAVLKTARAVLAVHEALLIVLEQVNPQQEVGELQRLMSEAHDDLEEAIELAAPAH